MKLQVNYLIQVAESKQQWLTMILMILWIDSNDQHTFLSCEWTASLSESKMASYLRICWSKFWWRSSWLAGSSSTAVTVSRRRRAISPYSCCCFSAALRVSASTVSRWCLFWATVFSVAISCSCIKHLPLSHLYYIAILFHLYRYIMLAVLYAI